MLPQALACARTGWKPLCHRAIQANHDILPGRLGNQPAIPFTETLLAMARKNCYAEPARHFSSLRRLVFYADSVIDIID